MEKLVIDPIFHFYPKIFSDIFVPAFLFENLLNLSVSREVLRQLCSVMLVYCQNLEVRFQKYGGIPILD